MKTIIKHFFIAIVFVIFIVSDSALGMSLNAKLDKYGTDVDQPIDILAPGVLGNDTTDSSNTPFVRLENTTSFGTLIIKTDGSFLYLPIRRYVGIDSFTYRVCGYDEFNIEQCSLPGTVKIYIGVPVITPPEVTVTGDLNPQLKVGDKYEDLVISAIDRDDGDVSSSLSIDPPNFNTDNFGTFDVVYSVHDNDEPPTFTYATRTVVIATTTEDTYAKCHDGLDNNGDVLIDSLDSSCPPLVNSKPIFTLSGSDPLNLIYGQIFQDPGIHAVNSKNEDISSSIISTNNVNNTIPGNYYVSYSIQDNIDPNVFSFATRTVIVATSTEDTLSKCTDGYDNDANTFFDLKDESCSKFVSRNAGVVIPNPNFMATFTPGIIHVPANISTTTNTTQSVGLVLGTSTSCQSYFTLDKGRPLSRGRKNSEEKMISLKKYLNKYLGTDLELNQYFGPITEEAVKKFQLKYREGILGPWGINKPTGIVNTKTVGMVNRLECQIGNMTTFGY